MKKLKTYKIFLEDSTFDVNATDNQEIEIAKEHLKTTQEQIAEFKAKKSTIDTLYTKPMMDTELSKAIENIIGTDDKNRNPFLVEYLHIANLNRKLEKAQKDITSDKIQKDGFIEEMRLTDDQPTKQSISTKITDISTRISTNIALIPTINKEIGDAKNALDKKMSDIEEEINNNITKITK